MPLRLRRRSRAPRRGGRGRRRGSRRRRRGLSGRMCLMRRGLDRKARLVWGDRIRLESGARPAGRGRDGRCRRGWRRRDRPRMCPVLRGRPRRRLRGPLRRPTAGLRAVRENGRRGRRSSRPRGPRPCPASAPNRPIRGRRRSPGKGVRVRAVGVRSACEPVGAGPVGIGGGFGVGSVHQGIGPLRAGRGLPRPGSGPVRSRLRPVGAGRRLRTGDADGDEPGEQFSADGFRLGGVHKLRGAEAERPAVGQEDVQPFAVGVDESTLEFGVRRCDLDRPVHESHVFIVSRKACVPDVRSSTA